MDDSEFSETAANAMITQVTPGNASPKSRLNLSEGVSDGQASKSSNQDPKYTSRPFI